LVEGGSARFGLAGFLADLEGWRGEPILGVSGGFGLSWSVKWSIGAVTTPLTLIQLTGLNLHQRPRLLQGDLRPDRGERDPEPPSGEPPTVPAARGRRLSDR
jgi:hypothetical protein